MSEKGGKNSPVKIALAAVIWVVLGILLYKNIYIPFFWKP